MPLNDLAKGSYEETMRQAKKATHEPLAMLHFGYCMGLVGQALYCKDIGHDEHSALSGEINEAIREWHNTSKQNGG